MSKKKKEQEVAHENVNSPGYRIGFNSKVFSAMKKYISIMMILACVAIHAKNKNDFNAWLSLMEEISNDNLSRLNSASLDERVETERYGQFLPQADETCPCDTESIWWLRGVYKPYCQGYVSIITTKCENSKWRILSSILYFSPIPQEENSWGTRLSGIMGQHISHVCNTIKKTALSSQNKGD